MSQVLHYHGSAQLHTSAHTTEAITNYRVATSTLQFLPCTSRLLSVFSFKKKKGLQGHHYASDNAPQSIMCQWPQMVENNFYQEGIHSRIQRWKKTFGSYGATLQNSYASSNDIVKFCKNFHMFSL
jgi:hypothetical protein